MTRTRPEAKSTECRSRMEEKISDEATQDGLKKDERQACGQMPYAILRQSFRMKQIIQRNIRMSEGNVAQTSCVCFIDVMSAGRKEKGMAEIRDVYSAKPNQGYEPRYASDRAH